ncbi:DUF1361 domain-containing protein [Marinilongibacter aquaticus]|uniref:DUF1361 domain-containing protein n=1 Tax=Marinilongibacter aquaticus TaxID=2975157 RepID=UPI0021BD7C0F|nr:DUF1361 domain-containing protein [Marinilongibacter aquaticus]UBM58017.1 DUF1361 domain-containing protein [Marinilongibacter aquaticus]
MKKTFLPQGLFVLLLFFPLLLGARILGSRSLEGVFLIWNLFLAVVPLLFAWLTNFFVQGGYNRILAFISFGCWLLFFPNSGYIITDLMHLNGGLTRNLIWFDSLLIFYTALAGLVFGLYSLHVVHEAMEKCMPQKWVWAALIVIFVLCGYGIYLGRFMRFNSWDLLADPLVLMKEALLALTERKAQYVTVFFASTQFVLYLSLWLFKKQRNADIQNA